MKPNCSSRQHILEVATMTLACFTFTPGVWAQKSTEAPPEASAVSAQKDESPEGPLAERAQLFTQRPYSPEYLGELRELIRTRRDITVVLVVSVPEECSWCRLYANSLRQAQTRYAKRKDVQFAVVDFNTFEDATEKMGRDVRVFPFTAVFRPDNGPQGGRERINERQVEPFFTTIGRNFEFFVGRKTADQLQGVIEPPLASPVESR